MVLVKNGLFDHLRAPAFTPPGPPSPPSLPRSPRKVLTARRHPSALSLVAPGRLPWTTWDSAHFPALIIRAPALRPPRPPLSSSFFAPRPPALPRMSAASIRASTRARRHRASLQTWREAEFYEHECLIKQLRDSLRARRDRHLITQAVKNGFVQPVSARTGSKDKEGRSLTSGRDSYDAAALQRL